MSLLDKWDCPTCFGLTGWPGDRARSNPLRKHLACSCEPQAAQEALLDMTVGQLIGERIEQKSLGNGWNRWAA